jgi:hypothetical protein
MDAAAGGAQHGRVERGDVGGKSEFGRGVAVMRKISDAMKAHHEEVARRRQYPAPFYLALSDPGTEFQVDYLGDDFATERWVRMIVIVGKREIVQVTMDHVAARRLAQRILNATET